MRVSLALIYAVLGLVWIFIYTAYGLWNRYR